MKQRLESLDALRGFAILTMVLSGSIAFGGVLPGWMYHAQLPPPTHIFNPDHPGITWVDLVFPFFLFSMGAAFPLVMRDPIRLENIPTVFSAALRRFALILFFALFSQHFKAWVLSDTPGIREQIHSLAAFILLFFVLYDWKIIASSQRRPLIRLTALAVSIFWMTQMHYSKGKGFDLYRSDIILVVLANMALFGTIIYGLTQNRPWVRLAILPLVMAIFLSSKQEGWTKALFTFNSIGSYKIDWAYKFYFLKYLFIVIPGMFAGEWLMQWKKASDLSTPNQGFVSLLGLALIGWNLYGLYTRQLSINLFGSLLLLGFICWLLRGATSIYLRRMFLAGAYLLILGLCFESYEGGIKKDPSTYSYYFVCSGLAFIGLLVFEGIRDHVIASKVLSFLSIQGQNPMVAYVTGSLLLLPLMTLTNTKPYWDAMHQNAWMGFAKGVVFTGLVSLITYVSVRKRWFWRT